MKHKGVRELQRNLRTLAETIGRRQGRVSERSISEIRSVLNQLSDLMVDSGDAAHVLHDNGMRRQKRKSKGGSIF